MSCGVIGTAGHVDHGKTALIRALTGTDTTHLAEEKKRGLTIDLGFASMELPEVGTVSIVDVPGHERFIKNMLAGAGGMDLVLLVIAADEGIMPQTREHLDILSLLDVERGLLVLTKTDLVDRERLTVVQQQVREAVKDTFLSDAPMVPVSCVTGAGIQALREHIIEALRQGTADRAFGQVQLPVDRVFSVEGFGTVVTGTLLEGTVAPGDTLMLYPGERGVKVRGLQVHGQTVTEARAGQRVAVNLSGVKRESISRGDTLASLDSMRPTMLAYGQMVLLPGCKHGLKSGCQVTVHYGAGASLCKVVLPQGKKMLEPGEESYVQLRFPQSVALKTGDRFVVRNCAPAETAGGGRILNCLPYLHKRFDEEVLAGLRLRDLGDPKTRVEGAFREQGLRFTAAKEVRLSLSMPELEFMAWAERLMEEKKLISVGQDVFLHRDSLLRLEEKARELLLDYHRLHPSEQGMKKEILSGRLLPQCTRSLALDGVRLCMERGVICEKDGLCFYPGHRPRLTVKQELLCLKMEEVLLRSGYEARKTEELRQRFSKGPDFQLCWGVLFQRGRVVPLSTTEVVHAACYEEALDLLRRECRDHGPVTLGRFRDLAGISRKYALLLLDSFDSRGLTRRQGEGRVPIE